MQMAYFNYPNPRIMIHSDPACSEVLKQDKPNPRIIILNPATISTELLKFASKEYHFAANTEGNDLWLDLDFQDPEFESALVRHIQTIIRRFYKPFERVIVEVHECHHSI
jgi:hypothetical protein